MVPLISTTSALTATSRVFLASAAGAANANNKTNNVILEVNFICFISPVLLE